MKEAPSEFGLPLGEALKAYSRPDLRMEYLAAGEAAGWRERRAISQIGGLSADQRRRKGIVESFKAAKARAREDVLEKVVDGRLVATGFVAGSRGRDPESPRRQLPMDMFNAPDLRFLSNGTRVSGNGLEFVDVRVGPAIDAPNAETALVGLGFRECFERVVVGDWIRREMEEMAFRQYPNWKVTATNYYPTSPQWWPVRYEDWLSAETSLARLKSPIQFVGGRPSAPPPDELIAVRERVHEQFRKLIDWVREGALAAEAVKEPKDHALSRLAIARGWWEQADVYVDVQNSALRQGPNPTRGIRFSDIRIVDSTSGSDESKRESPAGNRPPKRHKGGRPAKWPKDDAIAEIRRFAQETAGFDEPLSTYVGHIEQWFIDTCDDHPSPSTIKRYCREALEIEERHN